MIRLLHSWIISSAIFPRQNRRPIISFPAVRFHEAAARIASNKLFPVLNATGFFDRSESVSTSSDGSSFRNGEG